MQKRVKSRYIRRVALSEIFILVLATVAFAFVLSEANPVSAAGNYDNVKIVRIYSSGTPDYLYLGVSDWGSIYTLDINTDKVIKAFTGAYDTEMKIIDSKQFVLAKDLSDYGETATKTGTSATTMTRQQCEAQGGTCSSSGPECIQSGGTLGEKCKSDYGTIYDCCIIKNAGTAEWYQDVNGKYFVIEGGDGWHYPRGISAGREASMLTLDAIRKFKPVGSPLTAATTGGIAETVGGWLGRWLGGTAGGVLGVPGGSLAGGWLGSKAGGGMARSALPTVTEITAGGVSTLGTFGALLGLGPLMGPLAASTDVGVKGASTLFNSLGISPADADKITKTDPTLQKVVNPMMGELSEQDKIDLAAARKILAEAKAKEAAEKAAAAAAAAALAKKLGKEQTINGAKWIKGTNDKWTTPNLPKVELDDTQIEAALGKGAGTEGAFESKITGITGSFGHLVDGVIAGAAAYALGSQLAKIFKMSPGQTKVLSEALGIGTLTYHLSQMWRDKLGTGWGGISPTVWGIGIGALYFLTQYKMEGTNTITFSCLTYEPQLGGSKCEECNKYTFKPCSEYRCKSLGQACQLLNKETPGKEQCAWIDPKDVTSPTITPRYDVLSPLGLTYTPEIPDSKRPLARGVRIINTKSSAAEQWALEPFTALVFGINTNEPTQCKIDFNHTAKLEQMQFYFGESNVYEYNHTQIMRMPGPDAFTTKTTEGGSPIFKNDGTTQLFVRCMDANGNENVDEYSIKFCVDPSPDTTPPNIEGTSITSGNPIAFGTLNTSIDVYVNEPSECKWSIESKAYEQMENAMSCATDAGEINALLSYTCTANLTGLKNNAENKFYFRCKDQPGKEDNVRNVMVQSYTYTLRGSQPLNIISVGPNGTMTGGTSAVTVDLELETANGAEEGKAWCFFSPSGANNSYVQMFETDNYVHKQTLQLTPDFYNYYFRCTDLGGNSVEARTNFTVFSDILPPGVARVYREEGVGLKIVTDEDAECVYSLIGCNFVFDEGLKASYTNPSIKTNSYLEWKPNTIYYVKCRDLYNNEPNPAECSTVVKPVESTRVAD